MKEIQILLRKDYEKLLEEQEENKQKEKRNETNEEPKSFTSKNY